jgi:hypothetical protein
MEKASGISKGDGSLRGITDSKQSRELDKKEGEGR